MGGLKSQGPLYHTVCLSLQAQAYHCGLCRKDFKSHRGYVGHLRRKMHKWMVQVQQDAVQDYIEKEKAKQTTENQAQGTPSL